MKYIQTNMKEVNMTKIEEYELKANELNDVKLREAKLKEDDISSAETKDLRKEIEVIKSNYIKLQLALEEIK